MYTYTSANSVSGFVLFDTTKLLSRADTDERRLPDATPADRIAEPAARTAEPAALRAAEPTALRTPLPNAFEVTLGCAGVAAGVEAALLAAALASLVS